MGPLLKIAFWQKGYQYSVMNFVLCLHSKSPGHSSY
ncbi:MAG: hypothetical protein ACI97P_002449, partial [Arcticibacterium sp.]